MLLCSLGLPGCEDAHTTKTTMFESAEVEFRQGNYADAMEGYQAFLEQYPTSPLANTAEMRLRNIHREVSSVMERSGSPRPSYHGFDGEQSALEAPEIGAGPGESDDDSSSEL